MRRALTLAGVGLAAGITLTLSLAPGLRATPIGQSADPVLYGMTTAVVIAIALVACLTPALQVGRVDAAICAAASVGVQGFKVQRSGFNRVSSWSAQRPTPPVTCHRDPGRYSVTFPPHDSRTINSQWSRTSRGGRSRRATRSSITLSAASPICARRLAQRRQRHRQQARVLQVVDAGHAGCRRGSRSRGGAAPASGARPCDRWRRRSRPDARRSSRRSTASRRADPAGRSGRDRVEPRRRTTPPGSRPRAPPTVAAACGRATKPIRRAPSASRWAVTTKPARRCRCRRVVGARARGRAARADRAAPPGSAPRPARTGSAH